MDAGEIRAMRAYEILTRAYPFWDLDEASSANRRGSCRETVSLAGRGQRRVGEIQRHVAVLLRNLSMIPDEDTYDVYDMSSATDRDAGRTFVVNFTTPGEVFVQRGEMWRITISTRKRTW